MSITADTARRDALRAELATMLEYHDPTHPSLFWIGVVDVGPQRVLGCELYRDATGDVYAVGFADHEARSVFRVALKARGVPGYYVSLLEVVYDADAIAAAVSAFRDVALAGGRPEVRRRAIAELARALGGASQLTVKMVTALAVEQEGA
jgi:hypothetical protein